MPTKVLGIHDGHNASVALLVDGRVAFAIEEERLTRIKNQGGIPRLAIEETLRRTGIAVESIDQVALNGDYMVYYPSYKEAVRNGFRRSTSRRGALRDVATSALKRVGFIDREYRRRLQGRRLAALRAAGLPAQKIVVVEHHMAHASTAYHGSGFTEPTLVLTCDARGDRVCATVSAADRGRLQRLAAVGEDESVGRLYTLVTYLMGMAPLEHEYKVMGLAAYADPADPQVERLARKFAELFELDPANPLRWKRRAGVPSMFAATRLVSRLIEHERFDWVAAGLQSFLETFLLDWVRACIRETGLKRLALGGGVFMNVKLNKRILELSEVDDCFVCPSSGDESNAIGSAYWAHAQLSPTSWQTVAPIDNLYFGGDFTDEAIDAGIRMASTRHNLQWQHIADIEARVAELLAAGEVVARFKNRMEFGARALGNRSILANASDRGAVRRINGMIKMRDFWMPFAPSVMAEEAPRYYLKPKPSRAEFMTLAFDTVPEKREAIVAAMHAHDWTVRPQEVRRETNKEYYDLIAAYRAHSGEAIILNTSFNLHGFPIVYTPADALEVLTTSGLRRLACGNFLVSKTNGRD